MAGSGWEITDIQTGQVTINDAGKDTTGSYVYFKTGEGWQGSVFVPDQHLTTKKVRDMVRVRAVLLDEIGQLAEQAEQFG